jgi:hypothetical protein
MLRRLTAVLLVGQGVACASPTLPLPPPSGMATQTAGVDADHVMLSEICDSVPGSSYVQIVNTGHPGGPAIPNIDTGVIVFSSPCGAFSASVYGHAYDKLEITYEVGFEVSLPQSVTIGQP